ncbi:MAG: hypothetical protein WCK63_15885 [Betaproteobacteria bacterium]
MKFMKNIALSTILVAAAWASLAPASALADECVTRYRTDCVETDDAGRCKRFERVSYEECTSGKDPVHVSPATEECYDCFEYNKDGSCSKTRKVKCPN